MKEQKAVRKQQVISALILSALMLCYLLLWWNRCLGINTESWFLFYARRFLEGAVPYRDFYLFVTPGHLFENALLLKFLGPDLWIYRLAGLIQRLLMSLVLYWWLSRVFSSRSALFAAFACMLVYTGDSPDVLFYLNHSSIFLCGLAGLTASFAMDAKRPWLWLMAGVCASLCFFTKQTIGLGVSIAIACILLQGSLLAFNSKHAWGLLAFCMGWLIPAGVLLCWLQANGALPSFIDQIFLRGPGSKGTILEIITRPFAAPDVLALHAVSLLGILFFCFLMRFSLAGTLDQSNENARTTRSWLYPGIILGCIVLGYAGGVVLLNVDPVNLRILRIIQLAAVSLSFVSSAGLVVFLLRKSDERSRQIFLLALISVLNYCMFAISAPMFELMVYPGLGLLIALALDWTALQRDKIPIARALHGLATAGIALLLLAGTAWKMLNPFLFSGWSEPPVYEATSLSDLPLLKNYRLSARTARVMEEVTRLLHENTQPSDAIFVYPHIPVFYLLSDREPDTRAYVHWFDVAPDYIAIADAVHLTKHPPKAVVFLHLTDRDYVQLERMFRGGRRSGQREIQKFLDELSVSGYQRKAVFNSPDMPRPLEVWIRLD